MQPYEAHFSPPDSEYIAPDHSETSEIIEGRRHFAHVIRNLAEYHADEKDGVFRLSYEREQELAEAVYAGRLVEAKRAEKAAAEAAGAAAEAKAAEQATAESSEEPAAELSTNAAKETGTSPKKPELADGMAHLDELGNVEDKADTQEIEVAELSEEDKADEAILQAAARARKVLVEANARLALYFARASVGLQPQSRRLRRKGSKGDIVTEFLDAADVAKLLESPEAGSKPVRKTRRNSQKRYRPKDKTVGTYTKYR